MFGFKTRSLDLADSRPMLGVPERLADRLRRCPAARAVVCGGVFWLGLLAVVALTGGDWWRTAEGPARFAGLALLSAMAVALAAGYLLHFQRDLLAGGGTRVFAMLGLGLAVTAALRIMLLAGVDPTAPVIAAAASMTALLALALPKRTAFGLSTVVGVLVPIAVADLALAGKLAVPAAGAGATGPVVEGAVRLLEMGITLAAGGAVLVFSLRQVRTRTRLLEVGLRAGAAYAVAAFAACLLFRIPAGTSVAGSVATAADATAAAGGGVLAAAGTDAMRALMAGAGVGVLLTALLPYIERGFGITTSISLLELSDAGRPLLRRLAIEAPGTYSHSLLVGTLSEAAAEEIGADGLLCRVGCYYHDVGKLEKPEYFIENQGGGPNRHDQLTPAMSRLIITSHVKDGLQLADEAGLPDVLRTFIETHHGSTLLEYFHKQALRRRREGDPEPAEADFRYAGPKPPTRETAIVMLADGCEGAVRALPDKTPAKIEDVVRGILMKRLLDGQFDEADVTLAELNRVCRSLVKSLCSHHHGRISYQVPSGQVAATGGATGTHPATGAGATETGSGKTALPADTRPDTRPEVKAANGTDHGHGNGHGSRSETGSGVRPAASAKPVVSDAPDAKDSRPGLPAERPGNEGESGKHGVTSVGEPASGTRHRDTGDRGSRDIVGAGTEPASLRGMTAPGATSVVASSTTTGEPGRRSAERRRSRSAHAAPDVDVDDDSRMPMLGGGMPVLRRNGSGEVLAARGR